MPHLCCIFVSCLTLLFVTNIGQSAPVPDLSEIPPPTPPLVAYPPEDGQWTISVAPETPTGKRPDSKSESPDKSASSPSAGPGGVVEIRSVRTGKIKRDTLAYQNGNTQDFWFFSTYVLQLRSNKRDYAIVDASVMDPGPEIRGVYRQIGKLVLSPGFPGFDWLQPKYYDGLVLVEKTIPCYHYSLKGPSPEGGEPIVAAQAWVNALTHYPVKYSSDGIVYTYTFGSAPTTRLRLPGNFSNLGD